MHKTLQRQISRYIEDPSQITQQWQNLLDSISETYDGFDSDRLLIERSLEVSSKELKELVALLQATLDSTDEGIMVVSDKGLLMNHNKRFEEIWQISPEILETRKEMQATEAVLDKVFDPVAFKQYVESARDHPDEATSYVVKFKDGRTIELNSRPELIEQTNVGRVWSSRDITKYLTIEKELTSKVDALERLNKAMVDRELKMIELKKKIKFLEQKSN